MHNDRIPYAESVPSVLGAIFNDYETSDISYIHEWSFHAKFIKRALCEIDNFI